MNYEKEFIKKTGHRLPDCNEHDSLELANLVADYYESFSKWLIKQLESTPIKEEKTNCNNCQGGGCPVCNGSGFLVDWSKTTPVKGDFEQWWQNSESVVDSIDRLDHFETLRLGEDPEDFKIYAKLAKECAKRAWFESHQERSPEAIISIEKVADGNFFAVEIQPYGMTYNATGDTLKEALLKLANGCADDWEREVCTQQGELSGEQKGN